MPNTQTSVPAFVAAQVLTAQQQTEINTGIPVFATTVTRDAAFGGAGEKALAEGQFAYIEATNATQYYDGAAWQAVGTTPGLVLVQAETSFSAVMSYSANNVFTSTYRNYRIIFNPTQGGGSVTMKLRASAVDTSTNYNSYNTYGTSSNLFANNALGTDEWYLCDMDTLDGSGFGVIDVLNPQVAFPTTFSGQFYGASGAAEYFYTDNGRQNSNTQFDGFTITAAVTAMTGTYTVYGYGK